MSEYQSVGGYIRVSTQEQSQNGLSLESQQRDIEDYCRQRGYQLHRLYIDRGISARKNLYKRESFMEMMKDVKAHKITHIVVIRLDRFFRNVYDYHRMMNEYLIPAGCGWSAVKEEYDTTTTNGRLMINLRLSIAEQECDQDSDRIKDVFANRIKEGFVVYGTPPMGYKIENKRFVPSEDARIIKDAFESYLRLCSVGKTMQYINAKYGTHFDYTQMSRTLKKEIYTGKYRDNEHYCEPIVSRELFGAVQRNLAMNVRDRTTRNTYIFGGILHCECGFRMIGCFRLYKYYRCNNAFQNKNCGNFHYIREDYIETYLVENVEAMLAKYVIDIEAKEKSVPRVSNREQIQKKIDRLTELFVNGLISIDELRRRKEELESQIIDEGPQKITDLSAVKAFLNSGFRTIYNDLTDEEKQSLWRSVIKAIHINGKEIVSVDFL